MNSRADTELFARWWWTVDRVTLLAMLALIAIGLMLAFAASPAATGGPLTAGDFRYTVKQILFAVIAAGILGSASLLSLQQIKMVAAITFALAMIGSLLVLFTGSEVLGAKRWIDLGWLTLQPSEFLKPGFAVLGAAILADRQPMPLPKPEESSRFCSSCPRSLFLMQEPDVGQTALLLALWAALLFFAGAPLFWMGALSGGMALAWLRLSGVSACAPPHRAVLRSDRYRLSGRPGAEGVRAWRLDRRRSRRGHDQIPHSRRAFRLHLRGGGRGVRPRPVRRDRAPVLRPDGAAAAALGAAARSLRATRGSRARHRHRAAGLHQYGRGGLCCPPRA